MNGMNANVGVGIIFINFMEVLKSIVIITFSRNW